jgi:hypothetical protein
LRLKTWPRGAQRQNSQSDNQEILHLCASPAK